MATFNKMLKSPVSVESRERDPIASLLAVLEAVPAVRDLKVEKSKRIHNHEVDALLSFDLDSRPRTMLLEFKTSGQPRHVREAIHQLSYVSQYFPERPIQIVMAPYLSEEARALCQEAGVAYADLEGNCRIVLDGLFIERSVATKPAAERRELKSLFAPKSARVLRQMLRDPYRTWRVVDLSEEVGVSLGLVSNVRQALLQREWAEADSEGLRLTQPDALLDEWRDAYQPPAGEWFSFHTPLHGRAFDDAVRAAIRRPGRVALASFSAAQWLAPYVRGANQYVYVDDVGLAAVREQLEPRPVVLGGNLQVTLLADNGAFRDTIEPATGVVTTSPVQTYLDLWALGERGQEAAAHLRQEKLRWPL